MVYVIIQESIAHSGRISYTACLTARPSGPALFRSVEAAGREEARQIAEELFGRLDWGKGGQNSDQACVLVE